MAANLEVTKGKKKSKHCKVSSAFVNFSKSFCGSILEGMFWEALSAALLSGLGN